MVFVVVFVCFFRGWGGGWGGGVVVSFHSGWLDAEIKRYNEHGNSTARSIHAFQ